MSALGSILLFITIWLQIDTNKKQNLENRRERLYQSFLHDLDCIRYDINNFRHKTDSTGISRGSLALKLISDHFPPMPNYFKKYFLSSHFIELRNILSSINELLENILNSDLDIDNKEIIFRKIDKMYQGKIGFYVETISEKIKKEDVHKYAVALSFKIDANSVKEILSKDHGFKKKLIFEAEIDIPDLNE